MTKDYSFGANTLDDEEKFILDTLADEIKCGNVILFLGAAIHSPPPPDLGDIYGKELCPPTVRQLADYLSEGFSDELKTKNLSWIAQYYESVTSRRQLIEKIKFILTGRKPSPLIYALARMDFKYILTTNYDNLFEDALIKAGKHLNNKGIYKPNKGFRDTNGDFYPPEPTTNFSTDSVTSDSPFIYKIHGDISAVYETDNRYKPGQDAIVITDEDYIHFILRMGEKDPISTHNFNPIPTAFTKALSDPDDVTVLFIGYSLLDYNLRLLFKSAMWKKEIQSQLRKWSVDLKPDRSIKELYKGLYTITFIEKDAWIVIPYLYKKIFGDSMPL